MRNAIWFAKKDPTSYEFDKAKIMGYNIRGIASGVEAFALKNEDKAMWEMKKVSELFDAAALFGTITIPIMIQMRLTAEFAICKGGWDAKDLSCYVMENHPKAMWDCVGKMSFWI